MMLVQDTLMSKVAEFKVLYMIIWKWQHKHAVKNKCMKNIVSNMAPSQGLSPALSFVSRCGNHRLPSRLLAFQSGIEQRRKPLLGDSQTITNWLTFWIRYTWLESRQTSRHSALDRHDLNPFSYDPFLFRLPWITNPDNMHINLNTKKYVYM